MEDYSYWKKQGSKALFSNVDTFMPEQRRFAGKLLIVGGNKGAFFAVADALAEAHKMGVGQARALLPSSLQSKVPSTPELYFAEAETSGAFGKNAVNEMLIQSEWADAVLIIGDLGKNAETSIMLTDFMKRCRKPIYVTRDAIEAITPDVATWSLNDTPITLFLTLPQLQKLCRTLYYPKVVTLSMPTNQLVELLHKFTMSFGLTVATVHNDLILVAQNGEVVTEALSDSKYSVTSIWGGRLLTRASILKLWNSAQDEYKTFVTAINLQNE